MSDTQDAYWDAFLDLHKDLPREGPGEPSDVTWAAGIANIPPSARILDAACGPGADIAALLAAAPQGHVTAIDKIAQFVEQAQADHDHDARTTIQVGDMTAVEGPFDFIWCAGAVYFLGVHQALEGWRDALNAGGAIAFSQVCWFTTTPSRPAREGWAAYRDMTDEAGVRALVDAAGYELVAERRLSDTAWEAYYTPLDDRIDAQSPGGTEAMRQVLDEARKEAALWRAHRAEFGYLLCVVRPK